MWIYCKQKFQRHLANCWLTQNWDAAQRGARKRASKCNPIVRVQTLQSLQHFLMATCAAPADDVESREKRIRGGQ